MKSYANRNAALSVRDRRTQPREDDSSLDSRLWMDAVFKYTFLVSQKLIFFSPTTWKWSCVPTRLVVK